MKAATKTLLTALLAIASAASLTIAQADADRLLFTDSIEEATAAIREAAITRFGMTYGPPPPAARPHRRWWLFE